MVIAPGISDIIVQGIMFLSDRIQRNDVLSCWYKTRKGFSFPLRFERFLTIPYTTYIPTSLSVIVFKVKVIATR